ncbi:extensin family protein [Sphingomonas sp. GV3]|uniref:extensin-like domain-containing protein n=1 Tax=Sphingomonas sp. GV3 TaxID=3040671 RepID=UPI00280B9224|nr:extensin family protein [Sphingomonas sp. GV3]
MRALRRVVGVALGLLIAAATVLVGFAMLRCRPQDLPWTPLDLAAPIGLSTGRKLAALRTDPAQCRALLGAAGVRYTALPARRDGATCGYADAIRLDRGGAIGIALRPAGPGIACLVAAALALWEWNVVQPAAQARFGMPIASIDHFGSYACRRLYGRESGAWSEHARANAIDIAGFRLADGRRITVARDWQGSDASAAFLHDVRDGACSLYATVLSPDYNAAHRDHLHLDQADRGPLGWRACR